MATCTNCLCTPCECETPTETTPQTESCPFETKCVSSVVGRDHQCRERRIENQASSLLVSDGGKAQFKDGSQDAPIDLKYLQSTEAADDGVVTLDGGVIKRILPIEDEDDDYVFGSKGGVLQFFPNVKGTHKFNEDQIEPRQTGRLAVFECLPNGKMVLRVLDLKSCLIKTNEEGYVTCYQQAEDDAEIIIPEARPYIHYSDRTLIYEKSDIKSSGSATATVSAPTKATHVHIYAIASAVSKSTGFGVAMDFDINGKDVLNVEARDQDRGVSGEDRQYVTGSILTPITLPAKTVGLSWSYTSAYSGSYATVKVYADWYMIDPTT